MTAQKLRERRITQGIPARLIGPRAHVSCSRLSDIERGYVRPSEDERIRIANALEELIAARKKVQAAAERVGWPMESS